MNEGNAPLSADEISDFKHNLEYWCSLTPISCNKNCAIIFECSQKPECNVVKANESSSRYSKLANRFGDVPTSRTIWRWRRDETIPTPDTAGPVFSYLQEFRLNPYRNDQEQRRIVQQCRDLYNIFDLVTGCELTKRAIIRFPFSYDIIHQWALFHNRKKEIPLVRETLSSIISYKHSSEKVKTECYLSIFESHLNEFIEDRNINGSFDKLKAAREQYLERVPDKDNNGKYCYFKARYLEAEWLLLPEGLAKKATNKLREALNFIDRSLKCHEKNNLDNSYAAEPWWLLCHKAMLLKLLNHDYEPTRKDFDTQVKNEIFVFPLKKSSQMYGATSYLISEDSEGLELFFEDLAKGIKAQPKIPDNYFSAVDDFTYYHTALIFHDNDMLQEKYCSILSNWFGRLANGL